MIFDTIFLTTPIGVAQKEKGCQEIKVPTKRPCVLFVSLGKGHVHCYLGNYGKKYSFYFRWPNILKRKIFPKI